MAQNKNPFVPPSEWIFSWKTNELVGGTHVEYVDFNE